MGDDRIKDSINIPTTTESTNTANQQIQQVAFCSKKITLKGEFMKRSRGNSDNMIKVVYAGVLLAGLSPSLSFAAPNIISTSGTIANMQTLTISGSGFGAKSPAAPLLWDTFENGSDGTAVQSVNAVNGSWDTGMGSNNVFYTNSTGYGGIGKAARHAFSQINYNASLSKNGTFPTLYMDFKRYIPSGVYSGNYKPWRLYGASDTIELYAGYGCSAGNSYTVLSRVLDGNNAATFGYPTTSGFSGKWNHYQVSVRESTPGGSDGIVRQYLNGAADGISSTVRTRQNSVDHYNQIRIGHYMNTGTRDGCTTPAEVDTYTDNVYIDTTWARVELGNASTYAASTHREIQIPSAWSGLGNSITATINTGSFQTGEKVYLYVFDSNGDVNTTGYPVTIGTTGTITTPPAPSLNTIIIKQ